MRRLAGGLFRGAFAQVIAVSYCVMANDDCPLHGWTLGSELQRFYLLTRRISTFARESGSRSTDSSIFGVTRRYVLVVLTIMRFMFTAIAL
jgi:hypothetical protein